MIGKDREGRCGEQLRSGSAERTKKKKYSQEVWNSKIRKSIQREFTGWWDPSLQFHSFVTRSWWSDPPNKRNPKSIDFDLLQFPRDSFFVIVFPSDILSNSSWYLDLHQDASFRDCFKRILGEGMDFSRKVWLTEPTNERRNVISFNTILERRGGFKRTRLKISSDSITDLSKGSLFRFLFRPLFLPHRNINSTFSIPVMMI